VPRGAYSAACTPDFYVLATGPFFAGLAGPDYGRQPAWNGVPVSLAEDLRARRRLI